MRQHTEICLRNLTGLREAKFSKEIDAYFTDIERRYYSQQNGQCQIVEAVFPLWLERAKDRGIPLEYKAPPSLQPVAHAEPVKAKAKEQLIGA